MAVLARMVGRIAQGLTNYELFVTIIYLLLEYIMLNKLVTQHYIEAYNRTPGQTVLGVYKKPSEAKKAAERDILREMIECGGWGYKVISHTCQFFTAAYLYEHPNTGVIMLRVHTPHFVAEMVWHGTKAQVK